VREQAPALAERVVVVPLGSRARPISTDLERGAARERLGLPRDAVIIATIGANTPEKMGAESLDAFASVARTDAAALFIFAGEEADGGRSRARAAALGLGNRVCFLGRLSAADYAALVTAVDVGLGLRRPPTFGETSAALIDLLAAGVPTIVTDVDTFADWPDHVVRKVRWDACGPEALDRALRTLAGNRAEREALGRAARDHVRIHHDWSRVAECYADLIERCAAAPFRYVADGVRPSSSWSVAEALAIDGITSGG
jgi:glycosyltransferase involved in cell wall biosynthesis